MSRALALSLLALALGARLAHAGVTSLALNTGWDGGTPGPRPMGAWIGPALDVEGARASLSIDGRFGGSALAAQNRAARLRLSSMLAEHGAWRPEVIFQSVTRREASGAREGLRLHFSGARAGVWAEAAAEAALAGEERPRVHVPLLGFGTWARTHGLMLAGAIEQHTGVLRIGRREAAPPPDTIRSGADLHLGAIRFGPEQVLLSTAYATVHWDADRFELESVGGVTVGSLTTPKRWAQASVAWRLSPQLALVAAAGSRSPQYFAIDPVGERQAAVSVRFSQATTAASRPTIAARAEAVACRLHPMGEGAWRLEVRAPGARLVELQGDATAWQPVALHPAGGGRWEAELELAPGIHQLGLRVDGGEWLPPPGFPTAPDGFGGSVGVVVIE